MTVGELIEELKKLPQEMLVVVDGYEGGQEDPVIRADKRVVLGTYDEENWFFGYHKLVEESDDSYDKSVPAVVIGRR
jgi:hypothetical protein